MAICCLVVIRAVSTHSRPKAAGECDDLVNQVYEVSTHSRPKAAAYRAASLMATLSFQHTAARRRLAATLPLGIPVPYRFNTQPPEGGCCCKSFPLHFVIVSTHSRPKAAGGNPSVGHTSAVSFQHTAARRRLLLQILSVAFRNSFNTQPPEGGCICVYFPSRDNGSFNTQPPEGG